MNTDELERGMAREEHEHALVVAEIGEPERFTQPGQVASYAGLAARVYQSGEHFVQADGKHGLAVSAA